ncbi:MAG: hypothetical protein ABW148_17760, partial [Sedimenticola sp.]
REAETMICKEVPAGTAHWGMLEVEMTEGHAALLLDYADDKAFLNEWAEATLKKLGPVGSRMGSGADPQLRGLGEIIDTMQVWG